MIAASALVVAVAPGVGVGAAGAVAASSGAVSAFGDATPYSAPVGNQLNARIAGIASTPDHKGYWLVGADGGVFNYGDAGFYGSGVGSLPYPLGGIVGIAPTPDGRGYWMAGSVASPTSSATRRMKIPPAGLFPNAPMVGIAAVPQAVGYWLAGADGGVFGFGAAAFYGSMGGHPLNAQVVGIAATPDGGGYWLVAADGGVFSFGDAAFHGSMGGHPLNAPIVGIAPTPDGGGYWLVAADGGVFSFGDAAFHGSLGATPPSASTPVVGMATTVRRQRLLARDHRQEPSRTRPGALRRIRLQPTLQPVGSGAELHLARLRGRKRQPDRPHLVLVDGQRCLGQRRVHPQPLPARLRAGHLCHLRRQRLARLPGRDRRRRGVLHGPIHLRRPVGPGWVGDLHRTAGNQPRLSSALRARPREELLEETVHP